MEQASPQTEQRMAARRKARLSSLNQTVEDILPYDSLQSQADMDSEQNTDVSAPTVRATVADAGGQGDRPSAVNVMTAGFRDGGGVPVQEVGLFGRRSAGPAQRSQSSGTMRVCGPNGCGVGPMSDASRYPMVTTTTVQPQAQTTVQTGGATASAIPATNIQKWQASVAGRENEPMNEQDYLTLWQAMLKDMPQFTVDANRASRFARFADNLGASFAELSSTKEQRQKQALLVDQALKDKETARQASELNIQIHKAQTIEYYNQFRQATMRGEGNIGGVEWSNASPKERAAAMVELDNRLYAPRRAQEDKPLDNAALMRQYSAEALGHDLGKLIGSQAVVNGTELQWKQQGAASIDSRVSEVYWQYPDPTDATKRLTGDDLKVRMRADLRPILTGYIADNMAKSSGGKIAPEAFGLRAEEEAIDIIDKWANQITIGHKTGLAPDTFWNAVQAKGQKGMKWLERYMPRIDFSQPQQQPQPQPQPRVQEQPQEQPQQGGTT